VEVLFFVLAAENFILYLGVCFGKLWSGVGSAFFVFFVVVGFCAKAFSVPLSTKERKKEIKWVFVFGGFYVILFGNKEWSKPCSLDLQTLAELARRKGNTWSERKRKEKN
jgi:hypothetical protein